jgi:hypothetical protein
MVGLPIGLIVRDGCQETMADALPARIRSTVARQPVGDGKGQPVPPRRRGAPARSQARSCRAPGANTMPAQSYRRGVDHDRSATNGERFTNWVNSMLDAGTSRRGRHGTGGAAAHPRAAAHRRCTDAVPNRQVTTVTTGSGGGFVRSSSGNYRCSFSGRVISR